MDQILLPQGFGHLGQQYAAFTGLDHEINNAGTHAFNGGALRAI